MKITSTIAFLGIMLIILGLIHAYLYLSFVTFLEVSSPTAKKALKLALGLLAVSFILSSVSVRIFPGFPSQIYYGFSAVWFGAALYLMMASTPLWLVKAAVRWTPLPGLSRLPLYSALILYSLTGILVIYNMVNAHRIQVTPVSVSLKNLPDHWIGKTVAQLSDLHLGAFRDRGFLNTVVRKTLELQPDVIVITGDLFDGSSGGQERFTAGLERLNAPKGVYLVSGNHEVYAGLEKTLTVVRRSGIRVLDDALINLEGLQLIGIASPTMQNPDRPSLDLAGLPDYDRKRPSILLFHTPTDINGTSEEPGGSNSPYLSPHANFQTAIEAGISLQLSGHTHGGQFIPFTWLTEKVYGGYHYGLKRIGDFQIYISSGAGTWAAPFRSGSSSEIAFITLKRVPDKG